MKIVFASLLLLSTAIFTNAQDATPVRKKHFNLDNGIALQGYDPVTYFAQQKAVKGKKDITLNYQGATYYFASAESRETFRKNPAVYEPQYGGWCAYAMAKGEKVEVDPETFKIVDNKLYLFYNKYFNNTLKSWNKDEAHLKANADKNWNQIFH